MKRAVRQAPRPSELKRILLQQDNLCAHCQHPLDETLQIDHILALELGGVHAIHNLQALCPHCHARKTIRDNWLAKQRKRYATRLNQETETETEHEQINNQQEHPQEKQQQHVRSHIEFMRWQ